MALHPTPHVDYTAFYGDGMIGHATSGSWVLMAFLGGVLLGCHSSRLTEPEPNCKCETAQIGVVDLAKCLKQGERVRFEALEAARRSWFGGLAKGTTAILGRLEELKDQLQSLPLSSPLRQDKARLLARVKDDLLGREEWQGYLNSYKLGLEPLTERIRDALERCLKGKRLLLVLSVNRPVFDENLGKPSYEQTGFSEGVPLAANVFDLTADVIALLKRPDD